MPLKKLREGLYLEALSNQVDRGAGIDVGERESDLVKVRLTGKGTRRRNGKLVGVAREFGEVHADVDVDHAQAGSDDVAGTEGEDAIERSAVEHGIDRVGFAHGVDLRVSGDRGGEEPSEEAEASGQCAKGKHGLGRGVGFRATAKIRFLRCTRNRGWSVAAAEVSPDDVRQISGLFLSGRET